MIDKNFWKDKKVFITGHTGFKGSWLCIWLHSLGAEIIGYSLDPPTNLNMYKQCNINKIVNTSTIADVTNYSLLNKNMIEANPDVIIHMAAQALVREGYENPYETYSTNVMGTVNVLESVRNCNNVKAVLIITSDKCYENNEWLWGYRENDPLGGHDPYSSSKACAEIVTSAYRNSFFHPDEYSKHGVAIATARAGNVIGGGDWAKDRLIPDCIRALLKDEEIIVRNPHAIRPWQYVLEPLAGYLLLTQKLFEYGVEYGGAWNFGPNDEDAKTVEWIVKKICNKWSLDASFKIDKGKQPHEANYLKLDCSKTKAKLDWHPRWNIEESINKIIDWSLNYKQNKNLIEICLRQIDEFER